ncbi:DNA/RNA nuclease SfsA [Lutispora sp.]|uniref:DNA/RNA nuclease SfsA n=1 Tax=Lutispora sp. TaxID=2828727 RepID=UPI00356B2794
MKGVHAFSPNFSMDPEFAEELRKSASLGVKVLAYDSIVKKDEIIISAPIEVIGI